MNPTTGAPNGRTAPKTRRARTGRLALLGSAILLAAVLPVMRADATHGDVTLDGSNFEIDSDANLKLDHTSDLDAVDWATTDPSTIPIIDSPSGRGDESFGQGTKEDTASPTVVNGSIPPNKSELKYFGVYQEGTTSAGFLNMFWSRVQDPSGTTNMDFELNARRCTPDQDPVDTDCSTNGLTPIRSDGDVLITYDLSKGGTHPVISMRTWSTGHWGTSDLLSELSNPTAAGSINSSAIPLLEASPLAAGQSARTFGEAQLDLSSIFTSTACRSFGSVYLKSRASDAFTAAVKDFVPPAAVDISNCVATTITTGQSFYPNDSATVGVATGFGDLAGSVRFRLYDSTSCSGTALYDHTVSDISTGTGSGLNRSVSTSNDGTHVDDVRVSADTTLSWLVEFTSSNSGHQSSSSACDVEHSSVAIDNANATPGG